MNEGIENLKVTKLTFTDTEVEANIYEGLFRKSILCIVSSIIIHEDKVKSSHCNQRGHCTQANKM